MRVQVGATTYEGAVVDLRGRRVSGAAVAASVRGERCLPVVACASPTAVYEYAGRVHPTMGLRTRTALAAAARTRGEETPHDAEIAARCEELAEFDPSPPDLVEAADPVPDAEIADLRETVASHRGRITARRAVGEDADDARADLRDAATALSERETRRAAARETRELRREAARAHRDRLERRRQVADALANARRAARATLVDRFTDEFAAAVAAVPGPTPDDPFDASPVTAALAVLRIAETPAPVVLEVDRFSSPTAASEALDAPVVRC
ncbi:hypothetical protein ACOZ4I_16725 [Haloarcula salina]|uniref:DUF7856 family protein n=1 Tax=Haloarcula salina TaxID=1429914 RepID=UPI003C7010C3